MNNKSLLKIIPTYGTFKLNVDVAVVDSLSSLAIVRVTDGVIAGAFAKKIEGVCSPMVVDHCFAQWDGLAFIASHGWKLSCAELNASRIASCVKSKGTFFL